MKQNKLLLLVSGIVLLIAAVLAGNPAAAVKRDRREPSAVLCVYTTLPAEHAAVLAAEYEKQTNVRINFEVLPADDLLSRLIKEKAAPKADAVLADRAVLEKGKEQKIFAEYVSEETDLVSDAFRDEDNAWTGVWYDPVVFCVNSDYLKGLARYPLRWSELPEFRSMRLGITDFLAADAAGNLFCSLVEELGEEKAFSLLRDLHPRVIQYAKYLSTPVRMAGMGEVDLAVAVQSESMRYISEGYPLKLIYPADGTAFMLTGIGVLKDGEAGKNARSFGDWLLGDEGQLVLQSNGFFFVPANPSALAGKSFAGKNIVLFTKPVPADGKRKHSLLDKWVKNIRLK